jgi:N-acetylmuramoyl-L-alanine amidase
MVLRMLRTGIFLMGILQWLPLLTEAHSKYHQVLAQAGDGIYSLLRRYELDDHTCNFQQFYELNQLDREDHLLAGKKYFLPILIYTFNGKTIRSSIGIDDWDLAVRIQHYNERMLSEKLRDDDFRKSRVLWVPYHELNCPEPDLNIVEASGGERDEEGKNLESGNRRFPIFGKDYAYTPLQSTKLRGKVYYIVSGHGGPDPGAMIRRSGNMLCEDEYAYDVALRLCRNLIAHGATAYMITRDYDDGIRSGTYLPCDYDEVLWGDIRMLRQLKPRLFQRSDAINELFKKHEAQGVTEQRLICIHVDSRNRGEQIDLFFYHKPGDENSRRLALQLHDTMERKYRQHRSSGQYHGTVSSRDLHMLRETFPTSVYVELGNIRNSWDQRRVILESNRQALANWLFEGLSNGK